MRAALCAVLMVTLVQPSGSQTAADRSADALLNEFASPPNSAKPRVWWHWMNGNVTGEGIEADLEWMNRVGIGGAHFFEAGGAMADYSIIEPRLVSGGREWRAAVQNTASTIDRFGMELATAASPGWSVTGGPWVKPAEAMKKYVWSEVVIDGGRRFAGTLPQPPDVAGPFQNTPPTPSLGQAPDPNLPHFYADSRVIAYRLPPADQARSAAAPTITSSSGPLDAAILDDGDFIQAVEVEARAQGERPWIQYVYSRPQTIRGVRLGLAGEFPQGSRVFELLASDDGTSWRSEAQLAGPASAPLKTHGFAPVTARYFRLVLQAPPPADLSFAGLPPPGPPVGVMKVAVTELSLERAGVVDRFAEKAAFTQPLDYGAAKSAAVDVEATIRKGDVIDVTARLQPDGSLDWTPPRGRWRIVRFGYSLTGAKNHPAPAEATGLEVDKLNARHVKRYIEQYLDRFETAVGSQLIGARGLQYLLADSWEAGVQNWTDDLPAQFAARRGYDMTPWLPVLTGRVVESASASDKFLWDFRRTLQDLLAEHYAVLAQETRARGLGFYSEAQGDTWRALGDGMEMKRHADIPTAEYWFRTFAAGQGQPTLKADMKESASVANLYGKKLAAAESLTVFAPREPWSFAPARLKPVIDEIFAYGVNRILIHTSVHQPLDQAPGLTLGPFGQYLNRHETWAEQAKPFIDYIARSSYLLQQGRRVTDIAYFYGEDKPLVALFADRYDAERDRLRIEVPEGYDYDFVNGAALREELHVADGALSSRSGATYRVLFMPAHVEALTLPTVRKLRELVESGVVLVGVPPVRALGLSASDADVLAEVEKIWGDAPRASAGVREVGRGKVYWGTPLTEVLAAENVQPDVTLTAARTDTHAMTVHRRASDGTDIYFVANRLDRREQIEVSFRVKGRVAELWRAEDGSAMPTSYRIVGDRTVVPLELGPHDAVFVVFRKPTNALTFTAPTVKTTELATLAGPFELKFPSGRGAPDHIVLSTLRSWSEHENPGVRHFSGTATYTKTIDVPRAWFANGARLILDLGSVHEIAEVFVNGQSLGVLWKAPYAIDVTDALERGRNTLTIAVTNLWPNRLIGDAQPGIERKYTWTPADIDPAKRGEPSPLAKLIGNGWRANAALLPSGLLGPIKIQSRESRD